MFTEQNIITLLATTGKQVVLAKPKEEILSESSVVNKYAVGYGDILSAFPNRPIALDIYDEYGQNLIQAFDVSFICSRADVPEFWTKMFKALIGVNPIPEEATKSGLTLVASGPVLFDQNYIHWVTRWHIGFPTLYTF